MKYLLLPTDIRPAGKLIQILIWYQHKIRLLVHHLLYSLNFSRVTILSMKIYVDFVDFGINTKILVLVIISCSIS